MIHSYRSRRWPSWLIRVTLLILPWHQAMAVDLSALEAAIVFNVLQFVEWPGEVAPPEGGLLTICLPADSALLPAAKQLEGRPVRGMTLHVIKLDGAKRQCQAIYVDSVQAELDARTAAREPALLIGASDYRPAVRPSIQLLIVDGRLAFEIDQRRSQSSGLTISSRLLKLARSVKE